jgi:glycosyltransferase involved in cell wall biosynthesis
MNTLSSIGERPLRNILWIVNQHDFQTQKYRVFNYVEALSGYNIQSKVIRDNEIRGDEGVRFDLVVLNRLAATDASRALVTHCNSFGIPVVYDVDDLVFCPEQISLLRFTSRLPRAEFNLFRDGMALRRELMLRCNVVTTSTFALSQKVRQLGLTALVLPNTIALSDAKQADQLVRGKREDIKTRVRIGYFSGTKTHESDFAHCAHAVGRILAEYTDVELLVVGHLDIPENLHAFHNRVITRPLMSHREMFDELATVDVNLAPLELNNVFTDCKSELKIFEAALLSVPTVASPTSTFTAIIQHGKTGMLAASPDQWYEAIKYLVTDASVRKSMGLRAKQEIARRFLVTTAVGEAKAVYTALINNRISSPPAINEGASTWQIAKPLITVITVLYGKSNEVRYFLESLRRQDFPGPFEVLLVDDLSPDDSVKVVEDFVYQMRFADQAAAKMSIRILRNLTNIGNCASRNWAISEAAGEIVVVIDADCIVNRSYLFEHYRAHQNGHCDVAIGPMNIETRSVDPFSVLGCHEADCQLRELHADLQDPVNPNSFVNCVTRNFSIRKQFVQEHLSGKLFDQRFGYSADPESGFGWEDVEMGCRLYKSGARIRFLQTTVSIHVSHPATTDELTKPLRSLKNFRQLHETHPELVLLARQWSIRTYQAILGWAVTNGVDLTGNPDHAYLDSVFERYLKSPITVRRHRPLRVLTYRWHCSHQVELYRTGHKFTLVTGAGSQLCESWQWDKRPMPANAQFSEVDAIRPTDYDVAILHFDENVLHPEKCAGQVPDDWGATLLWFLNNVPLPKVAVCHGTPQFAGQYTANYQGSDLGVVDESSRKELVELMRDILVVCNSHQAKHEWGFKKATVVWHGFSPHDFPEGRRELGILTMLSTALRNRPHYNGLFVFERVQELLKETMNITNLSVPKPPMSSDSGVQEWSEANFRNYARELARYSVYLNPTLRSPMPRSRGEAMMAGLVTVSMHNHDVDLFIRNGTNGFFAESAEEIGEQLLFLEKNVAAKKKMAAASRCTALDVFNQDRYLSDWGRILEQLVG